MDFCQARGRIFASRSHHPWVSEGDARFLVCNCPSPPVCVRARPSSSSAWWSNRVVLSDFALSTTSTYLQYHQARAEFPLIFSPLWYHWAGIAGARRLTAGHARPG
jgi:hypothetical protein